LVIVLSSFQLWFFASSLDQSGFAPLSCLDLALWRHGLRSFHENRTPQAKIAGCAPLRWRISLLRLRNTPAIANVRADFFQRKGNLKEKRALEISACDG
jgi:hypothetical protein